MTREWNDYYAVQEDVLFRIGDIVRSAGASFAFPSQTLYIGRDARPDQLHSEMARDEVARWRKNNELPFPRFSSARLEEIENTLSYPPQGSPEYYAMDEDYAETSERLSVEEPEETEEPAATEAELPRKSHDGKEASPRF